MNTHDESDKMRTVDYMELIRNTKIRKDTSTQRILASIAPELIRLVGIDHMGAYGVVSRVR